MARLTGRPRAVIAAAAAALALAACGHHETQQVAVTQTRSVVRNPSTFPLFAGSQVVQVVPVSSVQMFAAIRASDPEAELPANFRGSEVIAETSASMPQLVAWLHSVKANPPQGLVAVEDRRGGNTFTIGNGADRDTAVGEHFKSRAGDREVYLIAGDPKRVRDNLGPVFTLIENYNSVPGVLRGPIDEQSKKQVGYSVTEMLDPKSPVGAVVAQVKRMQSSGRRAILLIDESKGR